MNKHQSTLLILGLASCSLFSLNNSYANEAPYPNVHSIIDNNALVTAPAYTTIITSQEIHDNHYQNVAEALTYANGVIVNPGSINTANTIIRIDGDDRVAFFIDGRRLNMDKGLTNGRASYDLDLLPSIMNVERIEIVHGAVGANALNYDTPAGAINIITKKGTNRETTIDFAGGKHGQWKTKAITSGSIKDWSWVATGGFDNIDYQKYKGIDGDEHELPNSEKNRREMSYRIDKQLTDDSSLTFNYSHLSNDTGTWIWAKYPQNYNYEKLINHFDLTYNYKEKTNTPAYVTIYHNYTQGDSYIPTGFVEQENEPSYNRWENTASGIDWHDAWQISKDHIISAGLIYRHTNVDNINNTFFDPFSANYTESIDNTSVYFQSTRRFDKLILTGTSLYNSNSEFGGEYVSNGALNYQADDKTTIYASLQEIYATPFLDELYFHNAYLEGNKNLNPETGYKGSLGIRHKLSDKSLLNFNLFLEKVDDPIGWQYNLNDNKFHATNFADQKKQGFQLDYTQEFSPKYDMTLSYAHTKTKTDFGSYEQTDVNAVAPNSYKMRFSYHDDIWHNNLLFTGVSGRDNTYYDSNYFIIDANFNYKINDQWSTYLKLANLTNESYEKIGSIIDGYCPANGRTVLLGMEYNF